MHVVVIEAEAFNDLKKMFVETNALARKLAIENACLRERKLLTVAEVAEITAYSERTIRDRKHEIGFFTNGNDIKFKVSDVDAWIEKNYIKPKNK